MLGTVTDMFDSTFAAHVAPSGITEGSGSAGSGTLVRAPAPVDIELSDLRVNAPRFEAGDSVTFAIADTSAATPVQCTAAVAENDCDSGGATATIPAGHFVTVQYQGATIGSRHLASFGWRYQEVP
jgi:hypothetical protein